MFLDCFEFLFFLFFPNQFLKMDLCGKIGSENHLISQELLQLVAQLSLLSTNNLEVLTLGELIAQIEQFNVQNDGQTEQLGSTSNKLTADIEGAKEKVNITLTVLGYTRVLCLLNSSCEVETVF